MRIIGIIPARYGSTRFPGKPLTIINGKSMIQRVYEQAQKANLDAVIVATDDDRIFDHVEAFGGKALMTSADHQSGTDRCFEALQKCDESYDAVINIQGDEPYLDPAQINAVAALFKQPETDIATLAAPIREHELLFNPNKVKVVTGTNGKALYFSRHPIPYQKNVAQEQWLQQHDYLLHVGIYGYKSDVLKAITSLQPSVLEQRESLEQLRWLENGYTIRVGQTDHVASAIDTPEDLERLKG